MSRIPSRFPALGALVLALTFLAASGCGGRGVSARGEVTFDGKPVEEGTITFEPADGQGPSLGGKIEAGRYEVTGPPGSAGKKIVRIRAMRKTGRQIEAGPPAPKGTKVDEIAPFIPSNYNEKSTLSVELTAGAPNEHPFHLKGS